MKKAYFFFLFGVYGYFTYSQVFMRPNEWKKYKRELFFTAGTSNFLGDLGGSPADASHYTPKDLNFNQSRVAIGFGGRYKLKRYVNVAAKFSYLNVKGDDAATTNIYRENRNLNFKSNIYELTGRIEGGYQSTKRGGNRYGIRKNYGRMKAVTHNLFAFVGAGVFYFNPKGQAPDGSWVTLYNLHTEGQGLPGGPKQYSRVGFSIPIGGYYKFTWNKIWSVGLEFSYRKTFSDYIDDVGSSYYNPAALTANYGPLSAQMADPSLGNIPGATMPAADGTPAVRGDKQKDAYMSLEIMVSYIFKKQRKSYRLRSKF
ncbi:MAG: hypothetical protein PSX36_09445 [bacterium]|nr:hypothetical protein [bacterium]